MRAILPGRPQSKRQGLCTAQWNGLCLIAYVSGRTANILSGPREILQTITVDGSRVLIAITIEELSGKIAVCDDQRIQVYNPVGRDEDDVRWVHVKEIDIGEPELISCLSWSSEEELLIGGSKLWLYHHLQGTEEARLIWKMKIANPVSMALVSNGSELIASCGHYERIVKIWRRLSYELDNTRFDVSYLPHPEAVIHLHWRKPWHAEQSLDSLLYTVCADKQIRLWTYSDPHSLSVMQLIATVDMNASIQPRRLSVGSMSQRRFVCIVDSRDFAHATERALQQSRITPVDHALEHLVEIANRSPEVCVILDGLGHMSAWGLENAGSKSQKPTVVFNVALVDDVKIQLNFGFNAQDDFVQLHSFVGGSSQSSLSILVHSFSGQVDWYESPIASFFDTSSRTDRLQLMSSWSGHAHSIDHLARGPAGSEIMSWTDEGSGIYWSQTSSGALKRICELEMMQDLICVALLSTPRSLITLHETQIKLWRLRERQALPVFSTALKSGPSPRNIRLLPPSNRTKMCDVVLIEYTDLSLELWQVGPLLEETDRMYGSHEPLTRLGEISLKSKAQKYVTVPVDQSTAVSAAEKTSPIPLFLLDARGNMRSFKGEAVFDCENIDLATQVQTNIVKPRLARAAMNGMVAITSKDGNNLYLWNLAQNICEWHHHFAGPDQIQKMAWTSTSQGHLMLFVSFSYHAILIGQQQYNETSDDECWAIMQNIRLRDFTTNYIGDVSWLSCDEIAIAAGNQIFVIEATHSKLHTNGVQSLVGREPEQMTAAKYVDIANATLPVFHPKCLRNFVMQSEYQLVRKILAALYEELKYFAEGDDLDSFLSKSPLTWITRDKSSRGLSFNNEDNSSSLQQFSDGLSESISNSNIKQLTQSERADLCDFISSFVEVDRHSRALDANGLRYLFELCSTPEHQNLSWRAFVFASRSNSQEALLDIITRRYNSKITWDVARRTGIFVWLQDQPALELQFENVAKSEYNKHEDRNPVDCSLYYLALNKKSVLQGLWRLTLGVSEKENTMKLLANNFEDSQWKATALKNAYALLSKRRFEYAAAFFLLGSSLKDAVNVCANQVDDIQLAIAVARVWTKNKDQSNEILRHLLETTVSSSALDDEQGRWIAVWAFSLLGDSDKTIQAIYMPLEQVMQKRVDESPKPLRSVLFRANDPCLLVLYDQIRSDLSQRGKWHKGAITQQEERMLVLRTAGWLTRAGLDLSALNVIRNWVYVDQEQVVHATADGAVSSKSPVVAAPSQQQQTLSGPTMRQQKVQKPAPTQFVEPSTDSLLDSFGF